MTCGRTALGLLAMTLMCGCAPAWPVAYPAPATARALPTALPLATASPAPPASEWRAIGPGLDYRELEVQIDERMDLLRLARADPAQLRFRVRYDSGQPRRVSEWLEAERALLAVNGGYFDPDNRALGLLIREGMVYGSPYEGYGGMFAVGGEGVRVRWNVAQPYTPGEPLVYAIQNFPMLVLPGGAPNQGIDDNGKIAPRTAVGQDRQGRIVFVVSPGVLFTLTGFGAWLAASDLDLDTALNLDGGSSSGLLARNGDQTLGQDSWVEVPDVIVVDSP